MPDCLTLDQAKVIARPLKAVPGFPWDEDSVTATAEDLVCWCRGAIKDGRVWSAEDQAVWLVNEVRLRWTEKWLGPGLMLKIFRNRFEVEKLGLDRQPAAALQKVYGKPDPQWSKGLMAAVNHKDAQVALKMAAVRSALYFTEGPGRAEIGGNSKEDRRDQGFWADAMGFHNLKHPEEVKAIRKEIADRGWR